MNWCAISMLLMFVCALGIKYQYRIGQFVKETAQSSVFDWGAPSFEGRMQYRPDWASRVVVTNIHAKDRDGVFKNDEKTGLPITFYNAGKPEERTHLGSSGGKDYSITTTNNRRLAIPKMNDLYCSFMYREGGTVYCYREHNRGINFKPLVGKWAKVKSKKLWNYSYELYMQTGE